MSTWLWIIVVIAVVIVAVLILSATIRGADRAPARGLRARVRPHRRPRRRSRRPPRPSCASASAVTTSSSCARSRRSPARASWTPGRARRPSSSTILRVAIDDADRLIQSVMRDRGYPVEDFDDRAALVSVDHPRGRRALPAGARDRRGEHRRRAPTPRTCASRCRTTARCSSSSSSATPSTLRSTRAGRSGSGP